MRSITTKQNLRFSVLLWTLVLAFLRVCMDSYACACVPQCLYGPLCLMTHAFLSVCMDSCTCVPQCLYGLLYLCSSVFVWTLVLVFLSVCMDSCTCVSQCLCGPLCLRLVCLLLSSSPVKTSPYFPPLTSKRLFTLNLTTLKHYVRFKKLLTIRNLFFFYCGTVCIPVKQKHAVLYLYLYLFYQREFSVSINYRDSSQHFYKKVLYKKYSNYYIILLEILSASQ